MLSNPETSVTSSQPFIRDAKGRHLLTTSSGEQYALLNKIDQPEAKQIEQTTGIAQKFLYSEGMLKPLLGKGNFGKVRLAQRVSTGEYVAVKKQLLREHSRPALRREAELQQRLRGLPHVLSAYDTVEGVSKKKSTDEKQQEVMYIFLPLGGLGSVGKLIEPITALDDQALRQLVILEVSKALLLGLWHLHQQGVYHLDIKPENILVAQTGEVLIGDLGCAEIIPGNPPLLIPGKREGRTIGRGDICYISEAREAAWEKGEKGQGFDARAEDCWAAGLSIMELLGGERQKIRPESLLRFELDDLLETLEEEFPEMVAIIRQLTHPHPPALSQILNESLFQQASLHDPALRETAVHYLQTFAKAERPVVLSASGMGSLEKKIYDLEELEQAKETKEKEKTEDIAEEAISTDHGLKSKEHTFYYPPFSQKAEESLSNYKETAPKRGKIPDDLPPLEPVIVSARQKLHPLRSSRPLLRLRAGADPETTIQQWREQRLLKQQTLSQTDVPFYIPLQGAFDREGKSPFDLETQAESWLSNDQKVLVLFADGGSGKSTFMRQWRVKLSQAASRQGHSDNNNTPNLSAWLPLYIPLVSITPDSDWLSQYLQSQGLNQDSISLLQKTQPLLLLLDGYDEMASYANLYVEGKLQEWSQIKLVITCRPSSIGKDYQIHFLPYQPSVAAASQYAEYFVQPFDVKQRDLYVHQYVQTYQQSLQKEIEAKRLGAEWLDEKTYQTALTTLGGLNELVKTPLLLRLVLTTLPQLSQQQKTQSQPRRIEAVDVYEAFIQQAIQQNREKLKLKEASEEIKGEGSNLLPDESVIWNYAEGLAEAMYAQGLKQVAYQPTWQFDLQTGRYQEGKTLWQAWFSQGQQVLRACLPLQEVTPQTYAFSHLSILEYLLARRWYQAFRALVLPEKEEEGVNWIQQAEALALNHYSLTRQEDDRAKLVFLSQWVKNDSHYQALLWQAVQSSCKASHLSVLAANAITILNYARVSFVGKDLSETNIRGADLSEANLDSVNLTRANLREVRLVKTWLRQASLQGADLTDAELGAKPRIEYAEMVNALAYSEKGRYRAVATCNDVLVHDLVRGTRQVLKGHTNTTTSVAWSKRGELASGSADGSVIVWDAAKGAPLQRLEGHQGEVKSVAWSERGELASGSLDKSVIVWDVTIGTPIQRLEGHTSWVTSVAWSAAGELASGSLDKSVIVWDVAKGVPVQRLEGHQGAVRSVAWSACGDLASGGDDHSVIVWDLVKGVPGQHLNGHSIGVKSVAWSAQGELASGSDDKSVILWDLTKGVPLQRLEGHTGEVLCVAWSERGELASGSLDRSVSVWNVAKYAPVQRLEGHTSWVTSVAWSAAGELASGSWDLSVIVWDVAKGVPVQRLEGHQGAVWSVAWSACGELASGGDDRNVIVWDVGKGVPVWCLEEHRSTVRNIAWSKHGELVSGSGDKRVIVWDLGKGVPIQCLEGHSGWVNSVAWSATGMLASGSWDKSVIVWDVAKGVPVQRLEGHKLRVMSVAWSERGELASGSEDRSVILWDLAKGVPLQRLQGHKFKVNSIVWNKHGELASGSNDHSVIVWDVATGKARAQLTGYLGGIHSIHWYEKGPQTYLATGSADHSVKVWQRIGQTAEKDTWQLLWSSHSLLWAASCRLDGAKGLTVEQIDLLKQREAIGEPEQPTPGLSGSKKAIDNSHQDESELDAIQLSIMQNRLEDLENAEEKRSLSEEEKKESDDLRQKLQTAASKNENRTALQPTPKEQKEIDNSHLSKTATQWFEQGKGLFKPLPSKIPSADDRDLQTAIDASLKQAEEDEVKQPTTAHTQQPR